MRRVRNLFGPICEVLTDHLSRLGESLSGVAREVCDSVAGAVGLAAAEAVGQGVAWLLRQPREAAVDGPLLSSRRNRPDGWSGIDRLDGWAQREPSLWG